MGEDREQDVFCATELLTSAAHKAINKCFFLLYMLPALLCQCPGQLVPMPPKFVTATSPALSSYLRAHEM